ncbi:MAG: hypothetical protein ACKO2G_04115 [Verrucomicrobiales bacterium]
MTPSNENATDSAELEEKPAINLTRLVNEFTAKEESASPTVVARAPVTYKSRPTNAPAGSGKKKKKATRSNRATHSSSGQGSWGGRIAVAVVWIVTLGTGGGIWAYHNITEFRARFDMAAKKYLPNESRV